MRWRLVVAVLVIAVCAVDAQISGGSIAMWGKNDQGQLGRSTVDASTHTSATVAVKFLGTPKAPINAYSNNLDTCSGSQRDSMVSHSNYGGGATYAWGNNANGLLGFGSSTPANNPNPLITNLGIATAPIVASTMGIEAAMWLASDGKAYGAGNGNSALSGWGTTPIQVVCAACGSSPIVEVDMGTYHSCIRTTTATYCWGPAGSLKGVLGSGSSDANSVPVIVAGSCIFELGLGPNYFWHKQISLGERHSVALATNNAVQLWGENDNFQISTLVSKGSFSNCPLLLQWSVAVPQVSITYISAGAYHTVALGVDTNVYTWGGGLFGQLGDGSSGTGGTVDKGNPVKPDWSPIGGLPAGGISQVEAGSYHNIVLAATGVVYVWGASSFGECGTATATVLRPTAKTDVPYAPDNRVLKVFAGDNFSGVIQVRFCPDWPTLLNGVTCTNGTQLGSNCSCVGSPPISCVNAQWTPVNTFTCNGSPSASNSRSLSSTNTATSTTSTTKTATASRTASTTNTATATASRTASSTNTATASRSASTTNTPTATVTASTTKTATASRTASTTNTATGSRTTSSTNTASATSTQSRSTTNTVSATPTASMTNTASATPTLTSSVTMTPSTTNTMTATATQSATSSISLTLTATPTVTPSVSGTPSMSVTLGASSSNTASLSTTSTATATATSSTTHTATATASASTTKTSTATVSPSTTNTASATESTTRTASTTNTASATTSSSTTNTASTSMTKTATVSPTNTPSSTASLSATNTASTSTTKTPTTSPSSGASLSNTMSASLTNTRSASLTNTMSASLTNTMSASFTNTMSASFSNTMSASFSNTMSASFSNTMSASFSNTMSSSLTNTRSASSTNTQSASSTPTQSASQSNSASVTSTSSPSNTGSPSLTNTASASTTNTVTATPSATSAASSSSTPSPSGSQSVSGTATASESSSVSASSSKSTTASAAGAVSATPAIALNVVQQSSPTGSTTPAWIAAPIVVGCLLLCIGIALLWWCCRRSKPDEEEADNEYDFDDGSNEIVYNPAHEPLPMGFNPLFDYGGLEMPEVFNDNDLSAMQTIPVLRNDPQYLGY